MDLKFDGKGVLLVGATAGMGLAAAKLLAGEGAALVVAGRDAERASLAVAGLDTDRALAVSADVSQSSEAESLVAQAVDFLGRLDGVAIFTGVIGHEPIAIDDARWRDSWRGKQIYDADGVVRIEIPRQMLPANDPAARFQVDGLSGATRTTQGVINLLHYWLGEQGFQPYLARFHAGGEVP